MIAFPFKRELEMKYKLYVLTLKLTCKLELSCSSQNILAASENISKDTLFSIYKTLYLKIFLANHKKYLDVLKQRKIKPTVHSIVDPDLYRELSSI